MDEPPPSAGAHPSTGMRAPAARGRTTARPATTSAPRIRGVMPAGPRGAGSGAARVRCRLRRVAVPAAGDPVSDGSLLGRLGDGKFTRPPDTNGPPTSVAFFHHSRHKTSKG